MEVFEKINYLIQEKELTKKEFVNQLRALNPILKSTGEVPSEQTIYRYLSGDREIKVELIPYIAEVLEVDENELFRYNIEYSTLYNYRYSKEMRELISLLEYVPLSAIEHLKTHLEKYKKLHQETLVKYT